MVRFTQLSPEFADSLNKFFKAVDEVIERSKRLHQLEEFAKKLGVECEPEFDGRQAFCELNIPLNEEQEELLDAIRGIYDFMIYCPFEATTDPTNIEPKTRMAKKLVEVAKKLGTRIRFHRISTEDGCEVDELVEIPIHTEGECAVVATFHSRVELCV